MQNSLKGAFLSGLIFPGMGQLALKSYRRGVALVLTTTLGMGVIVIEATRTARAIIEQIEAEGGQITIETIRIAAHQATAISGNLILNAALIILTLCWLVGTVDAYRVGRSLDILESGQK